MKGSKVYFNCVRSTRLLFPFFEEGSDQNVLVYEVVRALQLKCHENSESGCIHYVQD